MWIKISWLAYYLQNEIKGLMPVGGVRFFVSTWCTWQEGGDEKKADLTANCNQLCSGVS